MLLTVTNLYPRPNEPMRGLFNAQLFDAMHAEMQRSAEKDCADTTGSADSLVNLVFVPEWRPWRWAGIRGQRPKVPTSPLGLRRASGSQGSGVETLYVPVFHIPLVGRSLAPSDNPTLKPIHF